MAKISNEAGVPHGMRCNCAAASGVRLQPRTARRCNSARESWMKMQLYTGCKCNCALDTDATAYWMRMQLCTGCRGSCAQEAVHHADATGAWATAPTCPRGGLAADFVICRLGTDKSGITWGGPAIAYSKRATKNKAKLRALSLMTGPASQATAPWGMRRTFVFIVWATTEAPSPLKVPPQRSGVFVPPSEVSVFPFKSFPP